MLQLPSSCNVVILAAKYNPSIISKEWLYQKGIFTEPAKNFVHTPVFSLIDGDQFNIVIDESRYQLVLKQVTEENLHILVTNSQLFVQALPETPYKAVGFNYQYDVPKQTCDLNTIITPKDKELRKILSPNYELGARANFQFNRFMVTLSIDPLSGKENKTRISLNFHTEATSVTEVVKSISLQTKLIDKAESIVNGVCKNA